MKTNSCLVRTLLSESAATKMAREHLDVRFTSRDMKVLCEAYNTIPMHASLVKEYRLSKYEKMALLLVSEQAGVSPEKLLLQEGLWDSIKKLGKGIGAAIAAPFKAAAKAKKGHDQGATAWQSAKYGMTALPQLFKHGTHFGQGKASEEAKTAYNKILDDFSSHSEKQLKELTSAAKELGDDFPNNAKPESFRMMLMGQEDFNGIEAAGLGGLLGKMLEIRETQQSYVDQGGSTDVANQIIGRMRKMLQYYMGELHDTYQSLENKNRHGRPLIRDARAMTMLDMFYDNDYWYSKVCEGMYDENNLLIEAEESSPTESIVDGEENAKAVKAAAEGKSESELAKMFSDEGMEGLSDKQLNSMKTASSALRPLLVACVGAAMTALGISQGGSMIGDFEHSEAFTEMIKSFEGTKIVELPEKVSTEITTMLTDVSVEPGEGLTQFVGRIGAASAEQIDNMSGPEFVTFAKENGLTAESMKGLLGNSGQAFESLGSMEGTIGELGSQIGNGTVPADPFNMGLGSTSVKKKIAQSVFKAATRYTVKTFASGAASKAALGAALPTFLATAGVATAVSGLAVAALRKFAKNRKKTLMAAIDLLKDIKGSASDSIASDSENTTENDGPIKADNSEELKPSDEFDDYLKLPKKQLKKAGASDDEIDDFIDHGFDPVNMPKPRELLNVPPKDIEDISDNYSLVGLLLKEDMKFNNFGAWADNSAKEVGINLEDKDKENLALAFNLADHVGDVTDMPKDVANKELQMQIDKLEKQAAESEESISDMNKEISDYMAKLAKEKEDYKWITQQWANSSATWSEHSQELKKQIEAGKLSNTEAEQAKEILQQSLDAAKASNDAEVLELNGKITEIKSTIDDLMQKGDIDAETIKKAGDFSKEMFGTSLEEILKDPIAFAEKYSNELSEKQRDAVDKALEDRNEDFDKLEQQYEDLKKSSENSATYGNIYTMLKSLTKSSKNNEEYEIEFRDDVYDWIKSKPNATEKYPSGNSSYSKLKKKPGHKQAIDAMIGDLDTHLLKPLGVKVEKGKNEATWHRGDIIMERWSQLADLPMIDEDVAQEKNQLIRESWWSDKHETLADQKYSDALDAEEAQPSQEDMNIMFDQISDEVEDMGSAVAEQSVADMWMDENGYLYRGVYIDTRAHQGGKVKINWPGWDEARYRGDLGW